MVSRILIIAALSASAALSLSTTGAQAGFFRVPKMNLLNPQPLPPKALLMPGGLNRLNPQPLPPKEIFRVIGR